MRVLVILEDPTLDEHVAVPIVQRLFDDLGAPARVAPLREPHLRGVTQALAESTLRAVIAGNPMVDLFLLLLDRDCDRDGIEAKAMAREALSPKLVAAVAHQELETWLLALHRDTLAMPWSEVRAHCDPKESFAEPLLARFGGRGAVGGGRKAAMRALAGQWKSLLTVCPELTALRSRLAARL